MSLLLKIYGIVDLVTAFLIYFDYLSVPDTIRYIHIFFLLFKGIPSLVGTFVSRAFGIIDVLSAIILLFLLHVPHVVKVIHAVVLVYKGIISLL